MDEMIKCAHCGAYFEQQPGIRQSVCTFCNFVMPRNVSDDKLKSERVLRDAMDGNAEAQYKVGLSYFNGKDGFDQDYKKAFEWFSKAYEQSNRDSLFYMGYLYSCGLGVEKDIMIGFDYYFKAHKIRPSYMPTVTNIGYNFEQLGNFKKTRKWYCKAAKENHAHAQNNLGILYREGRGVKRNIRKAIVWFTKAAEQGHEKAKGNLADALKKIQA